MNDNNRRHGHPSKPLLVVLLATLAGVLVMSGCAQFTFPPLTMDRSKDDAAQSTDADTETVAEADSAPETIPDPIPEPQETPKPGKLYEWSGDGRRVTRIVINTNEQKARFYDGKEQIGWTTVASGKSTHPTPRGEFTILEKVADKRSNLYGKIVNSKGKVIKGGATGKDRVPAGGRFVGASMPHFMRMTYDGIGMHAGPIPRPGSPASHGCIRMPKTMAATVFKHVDNGTAVTVIGNGPDYGNYGERIARQQAEERARRAAAAAAAEGSALDALDAEVGVMRNAQAKAGPSAGASYGSGSESSSGQNRTGAGRSAGETRRTSGSSTTGTRSGTRSSASSQTASASTQPTARPSDPTPPNAAGDVDSDQPRSTTVPAETSLKSPAPSAASASPTEPESPEPAVASTPQAPAEPTTQVPAPPLQVNPVQVNPAQVNPVQVNPVQPSQIQANPVQRMPAQATVVSDAIVQQPQTSAQATAPAAQPTVSSEPNSPQKETAPETPAPSSAPASTQPTSPVRSASEPEAVPEPA